MPRKAITRDCHPWNEPPGKSTWKPGGSKPRDCHRVRATPAPGFALRPPDGTPGAGEEAGLHEERHREGLRHGLAVEPLDREAPHAAALHVRDQGGQGDAEPFLLRLPERHERSTAPLDVEHGLAAQEDDVRTGDPGGAAVRTLRP